MGAYYKNCYILRKLLLKKENFFKSIIEIVIHINIFGVYDYGCPFIIML